MTPEQKIIAAKLSDREWRLDNLYWIKNENGKEVRFKRNEAQMALWSNLHYRNLILKARQLGFSTFIAIVTLDQALFEPNTNAGIIDLTMDDAKKKLDKIRFAYEKLPKLIKSTVQLTTDNTETLKFSNGSRIEVGTSHRGDTLQVLHGSEFGKIAAKNPAKAIEIQTGAFGAVHQDGWIFIESTAEGHAGKFFEMVEHAGKMADAGAKLTPLDFKLHFFPWWQHPSYHIDPDGVIIEPDLVEYFADLKARHGIDLTERQRAWYAKQRHTIGFDLMLREYPSTRDEPFKASIEGAIFKQQMTKMREQRRITSVPYDPSLAVQTFWDIGHDDNTAIWFHQARGNQHFFIDYYENSGEGINHYARILAERREKHGYSYGTHYGPHDLDRGDFILPSETRKIDVARNVGLEFQIVDRIKNKWDAIEAARSMLSVSWIDEQKCARGIVCLDSYRKVWSEKHARYTDEPYHDWASDCADALMTGACGFVPAYIPAPRDAYGNGYGKSSSSSAWAA